MNTGSREGWPSGQNQGPGGAPSGGDSLPGQSTRSSERFDSTSGQQQQSAQSQSQHQSAPSAGPVLPPPSGNYHPPGGIHNLPSISGLAQASQASPQQPVQRASIPDAQSNPPQHHIPGGSFLPALNPVHPPQHGQPTLGRGLDAREGRELNRHIEDVAAAEQRERESRERQHQEQATHENQAGPMPLHQPVALTPQSRGLHGTNGLLGNVNAIANTAALQNTINASNTAQSIFNPAQPPPGETTPRMQHAVQPPPQNLMVPFTGPAGAQQQQALSMGQGQQPILNDALSYLDQVKVQFADQPDVYNRFLDIMKDFKSGAIDTPGVIDRVSTLFAGNPTLIQGFNTFLPQGYRIECGEGGDPNSIRVTTPMGTTVSRLPGRPLSRNMVNGVTSAPSDRLLEPNVRNAQGNWQPGAPPAQEAFSPARAGQPLYAGPQNPQSSLSPELQRVHPDTAAQLEAEQRGVSQLQNAAAVASAGQVRHNIMSPLGGAAARLAGQTVNGIATAGQSALAGGAEKRGPVEFNHAISYVNKIKNRFAQQPDIYKQFLEILQTYQRESKPIQDVYAQVTHLFGGAPDLLEDFKQFLPESTTSTQQQRSTAMARNQAEESAPTSNLRGDASYQQQIQQLQHTPRPDPQRLPPIGNFSTTPAKDSNKRKRGERQGAQTSSIPPPALEQNLRGANHHPGTKRSKQHHHQAPKSSIPEGPAVSPTLTPALPEPLSPTTSAMANSDELAFFDRVKKFINNKNNMNEFLKLCNLFSQDLITSEMLVTRAHSFIGGNPELMTWFKNFMGFDPKPRINEPKAQPTFDADSKVSLSNCRGLGPSYRLLPKRDTMRECSGRDDLCRSVLNDEWASHPTWASEDSGFVAHRKNAHEEGLHRIEEERHDYDFNIEACLRTVQQLEPIAQQIHTMSTEERAAFVLPKGLGGQSESIYKRVIMKVYGREQGHTVIDNLFETPYKVVPVVLARLKQKLEEWKAAQREWQKVWREQTQRIFWKSLDHQSIGAKQADKRQFQTKTIQTEIQVKHEEQKRQREVQGLNVPEHQFAWVIEDVDILYDASRLLLIQVEQNHNSEHPRLLAFLREFVPLFFGLDLSHFEERIRTSPLASPGNEDPDDETSNPDDFSSKSQRGKGKNQNLLRGVLDRGRHSTRTRGDSNASGSRASTPEVGSVVDEDMIGAAESSGADAVDERPQNKWLEHPNGGNQNELAPEESFERESYHMYSNLPLYCFFRMLIILYERLYNLKKIEEEVRVIVQNAQSEKPGIDFKLIDKLPSDFFSDTSSHANYYSQILVMFEDVLKGDMDMTHVEETLRRFYLQNGWQLYAVDKMLAAFGRFAVNNFVDPKDKSWEIYQLFKKDRQRVQTTHKDEISYRRNVEKFIKDGEVFRISFRPGQMQATVKIFKKDELTFNPRNYTPEQRWRYYISSFTRTEPTEQVDHSKVGRVFLNRQLAQLEDDDSDDSDAKHQFTKSDGSMTIRISVNGYKMIFEPNTLEYHVKSDTARSGGPEGIVEMESEARRASEVVNEKFVMNNAWMKGLSKEEVDLKKAEYARLKGDDVSNGPQSHGHADDIAMADAA